MTLTRMNKSFHKIHRVTVETDDGVFEIEGTYVRQVSLDITRRELFVTGQPFAHDVYGPPWLRLQLELEGPAQATWKAKPPAPKQLPEPARRLQP